MQRQKRFLFVHRVHCIRYVCCIYCVRRIALATETRLQTRADKPSLAPAHGVVFEVARRVTAEITLSTSVTFLLTIHLEIPTESSNTLYTPRTTLLLLPRSQYYYHFHIGIIIIMLLLSLHHHA